MKAFALLLLSIQSYVFTQADMGEEVDRELFEKISVYKPGTLVTDHVRKLIANDDMEF